MKYCDLVKFEPIESVIQLEQADSPAAVRQVVQDKHVAKAAKAISGKFKVVRLEIPATKKSLRNIICGRLEDFMLSEGMSFSFPADDQVDSNKDDVSKMMAQLNEKYPDYGFLLV